MRHLSLLRTYVVRRTGTAAAAELGDDELLRWATQMLERADALDAEGLAAVLRRLPRSRAPGLMAGRHSNGGPWT